MICCIILFANSFFAVEASLVVNKFGLDLFVNNYLIPLYKPDITLFRTWNDFKYHQGFEYQALRLVNKNISNKLKYEFSKIREWVDNRRMPAGFLLKYPEDDLSAEEKKYLQFIAACKDNTLTKDQFSYYSEYIYSTATGYLLYTYFSQHVTKREPFEKSLYAEFMKFSLDLYKQDIGVQKKIFKKLELETTVLNFLYNDPFLYNSNESFLLFISDQQLKTSIALSMEISNCALLNLAQSPTESLERLVAVVDQDYTYIEKLWLLKFVYKDSFNSPIDEREIQRTTPIYYGYGRNAQKKRFNQCEYLNIDYYKDALVHAHYLRYSHDSSINNNRLFNKLLVKDKKIHSYEFFIAIIVNLFKDFFDKTDRKLHGIDTNDYYQVADLNELCNEKIVSYCSFKQLTKRLEPYLKIYFKQKYLFVGKQEHYKILDYVERMIDFLVKKNIIQQSVLSKCKPFYFQIMVASIKRRLLYYKNKLFALLSLINSSCNFYMPILYLNLYTIILLYCFLENF